VTFGAGEDESTWETGSITKFEIVRFYRVFDCRVVDGGDGLLRDR